MAKSSVGKRLHTFILDTFLEVTIYAIFKPILKFSTYHRSFIYLIVYKQLINS